MELLSVNQSAKYLGVHPNTIRNLIVQGKLPAYRIGKSIRIDRQDLDDALEKYQVEK